MTPEQVFGKLNKDIKGLTSGVASASVSGSSIIFTMNDGSTQTITFPQPKDGASIVAVSTNENNQFVFSMSDGTEIVGGEVPASSGVSKEYVDSELSKKANNSDIPTKVSGLQNDSNYQTDTDVATALTPYAKSADVTKEITNKVAEIVADAPEDFNTLKEMSDWISNHENDASAMNSAISDNKTSITALQTGKADKSEIPTTLPANGGNASTVNGHTVKSDVPANAKFTDTTYSDATTSAHGLMTPAMVTKLDGIGTSQGRNLIPYPLTDRTTNGITYTVQSDGSVVANGTASADNNAYYNFAYKTLKLGDTSYTLSCEGLPKSVYVYVYDETISKAVANVSDVPVAKTFVGDSTHIYSLSINVGKGISVSDLAIKPILEMGTIAHTYEPISESNVNLKDAIDKVPTSQGRNLISYPYYNGTSYELNGITYTVNEADGTITVNGTATKESDFRLINPYEHSGRKTLELGQTYTLSDGVNQPNGIGYQAPVYFQFVRIDTTKNDFNYGISTNYGNMTWTASDANLLQYGIRIVVRSGVTVDNVVLKPMLEIGAIAHSYEPTTESNISLKSAIDGKADKSKVADVNWTSVDISSVDENTHAGATINYCIKNGICYMSILNIGFKTANQAIILGANSIPKPSSDYCWCPLVCVADPSYSVLIHPNLSGGLEHHVVGLTSQVYSGLFSYPVAES